MWRNLSLEIENFSHRVVFIVRHWRILVFFDLNLSNAKRYFVFHFWSKGYWDVEYWKQSHFIMLFKQRQNRPWLLSSPYQNRLSLSLENSVDGMSWYSSSNGRNGFKPIDKILEQDRNRSWRLLLTTAILSTNAFSTQQCRSSCADSSESI